MQFWTLHGGFCICLQILAGSGSSIVLAGVDLDIAGGVLVLHKEQSAGQRGSEEREHSKQSFENFHRFILLGG